MAEEKDRDPERLVLMVSLLPDGKVGIRHSVKCLDPELNDPGVFGFLISELLDLLGNAYAQTTGIDELASRAKIVKMLTETEAAKNHGEWPRQSTGVVAIPKKQNELTDITKPTTTGDRHNEQRDEPRSRPSLNGS